MTEALNTERNVEQPLRKWLRYAIGHGLKRLEVFAIDWLLYPAVLGYCSFILGPAKGIPVAIAFMIPVTGLVCWLEIRGYDWSQKDWLGFEEIKKLRESDGVDTSTTSQLFSQLVRKSDVAMFLYLATRHDAFMTTLYFRKGAHTYGMTNRDWIIFLSSLLISNVAWTVELSIYGAFAMFVYTYSHVPLDVINQGVTFVFFVLDASGH